MQHGGVKSQVATDIISELEETEGGEEQSIKMMTRSSQLDRFLYLVNIKLKANNNCTAICNHITKPLQANTVNDYYPTNTLHFIIWGVLRLLIKTQKLSSSHYSRCLSKVNMGICSIDKSAVGIVSDQLQLQVLLQTS